MVPLGLLVALVEWPLQALSELGFVLQRYCWAWPLPAALLVLLATAAMLLLAWGPLAAGRGGGVAPLLALDRSAGAVDPDREQAWLQKLSLRTQLIRLPLVLFTHIGGMSVGVESPSAALGAGLLLALRRRWPAWRPLAGMPLPLVAAIGGGAGLGVAFRSPLLGITYGLEELGRRQGLPLVLPTLVIGGVGSLISTTLGQPARLPGLHLGALDPQFLGWAALLTLVGCGLGSLFVRCLIPLASWLQGQLGAGQAWLRRIGAVAGLSLLLALIALASGGLSLNDGSLSLGAAFQGEPGSLLTLLWRIPASLLSIAAGAPGGLMHDAMTLGALLVTPLKGLDPRVLAQLAAVGATAVFAAANGTPIFCATFVFTLQGDPASLPLLLLVSGASAALAERWRGEEWNAHQAGGLLRSSQEKAEAVMEPRRGS